MMIEVSDIARTLIDSGRFVTDVRVSAWLGDELLAADVPISDGSEEADRTLNVPERVQLQVPRYSAGVDWMPTDAASPLAAYGQTLKVSIGIGQGTDEPEWFQRGEFLITDTQAISGQELSVTCAGLLTLVQEAKLPGAFQPTDTLSGALRKLVEPAVLVDLSDAPADRTIASTPITWETDRMAAVNQILDAWPADRLMTEQGILRVIPTTPPTVTVKTFHDDAGGTVVSAAGGSTRGTPTDVVIVTGYSSDGAEVRAVTFPKLPTPPPPKLPGAKDVIRDWVDRQNGKMPVPRRIDTGLIDSIERAQNMAKWLQQRERRRYALKRLTIETTPDPTLQLGDCVGVWADGVWTEGTVEHLRLPYRPALMTVQVVSLT